MSKKNHGLPSTKRRRKLDSQFRGKALWHAMKQVVGNTCVCCWEVASPLSRDHIVPLAMGGENSFVNVQPLCRECNQRKHNKVVDYRPAKLKAWQEEMWELYKVGRVPYKLFNRTVKARPWLTVQPAAGKILADADGTVASV